MSNVLRNFKLIGHKRITTMFFTLQGPGFRDDRRGNFSTPVRSLLYQAHACMSLHECVHLGF
jgi:hypothetical protein